MTRTARNSKVFGQRLSEFEQRQNEQDNRQSLEAALLDKGEVRLRVQVGVYGPGTAENRKSRYWWMLGQSMSVVAADVQEGERFLRDLRAFVEAWV
jgi:hypothetical protein